MQIRFAISEDSLDIYRPDGQKFLTTLELSQYADQENQRADQESQRADQENQRANQESQRANQESQRADQERQRADQEYERAERLLAQLRAMGIQPA